MKPTLTMRIIQFTTALLLGACIVVADDHEEKPVRAFVDDQAPGWVSLGEKDFAHVNSAADTWSWTNGVLHCTGKPVSVLRTAKQLLDARVPRKRIREALRSVRDRAGVRITAEGRDVVVGDGTRRWAPGSGQMPFDFAPAAQLSFAKTSNSAFASTRRATHLSRPNKEDRCNGVIFSGSKRASTLAFASRSAATPSATPGSP